MCRMQRHAAEKSGPRRHKRMTYDLRSGRVYREEVSARVFSRHVDGIYANCHTLQHITPR